MVRGMAQSISYVDASGVAIVWSTAVVSGAATTDIYQVVAEDAHANTLLWARSGQAVSAARVADAQANTFPATGRARTATLTTTLDVVNAGAGVAYRYLPTAATTGTIRGVQNNGEGVVYVDPTGTDTIDGGTAPSTIPAGGVARFQSNGAGAWVRLAAGGGTGLSATASALAADAAFTGTYAPIVNPTFTGSVSLPGGGPSLRRPVNGSVTVDGTTAKTLPGDKVAYAFSAKFQGGFSGDTGGNPGFAWGANDFIVTGSTSGDAAGLTNLLGRETEVHLYAPSAALTNMKGLQVDCKVEASATSATVTTMFGIYVSPVSAAAGTVTNAYGVYIEAPTTGASVSEALHVVGTTSMVGPVNVNGATALTGNLTHGGGAAKFAGASTGNLQGAAAGAYIGSLGGNYGVNLSDGTNTWGVDLSGGSLRFMKAGVQQNAAIDLSGNMTVRGGVGFYNTTPTTKQSISGSRGANAALASLLTALAAYGLVTDGTTA
jgi:hypothetical protein